jgi:hypothetical protein
MKVEVDLSVRADKHYVVATGTPRADFHVRHIGPHEDGIMSEEGPALCGEPVDLAWWSLTMSIGKPLDPLTGGFLTIGNGRYCNECSKLWDKLP